MESRVGFWPRLGAYFIDTILVMAVAALTASFFAGLFPQATAVAVAEATDPAKMPDEKMRATMAATARFLISAPFVGVLYFLTEALGGWSVGKLLLGLRIGSASGRPAARGQLAGRFAIKASGSLLGALGIAAGLQAVNKTGTWVGVAVTLGFFLALGRARQALHDLPLGTAVFRKSDLDDARDAAAAGPSSPVRDI